MKKIVNILRNSANSFIPKHKANFYKFWWDQELNELKANSVRTNNVWKAAGKSRTEQIFMQSQTVKAAYKLRIRQALKEEKVSYSNDLHDALLAKSGNDFCKSWHSKCGDNKATPRQINGITNDKIIVSNFAEYFSKCCTPNSAERSYIIYSKYAHLRQNYC